MEKKHLLLCSLRSALMMGVILGFYISVTTFWRMPFELWQTLHNSLILLSLVIAALLSFKHRQAESTFPFMLLSIAVYFLGLMFFYLGSYFITTAFFIERMVWIPFFHHDFTFHGFQSVAEYLNYKNNFRDLLQLQFFSFLMSSLLYFVAGCLGYSAGAIIIDARKPS